VQDWLSDNGISSLEDISQLSVALLEDALGISKYLQDKSCQHNTGPYSTDRSGWSIRK